MKQRYRPGVAFSGAGPSACFDNLDDAEKFMLEVAGNVILEVEIKISEEKKVWKHLPPTAGKYGLLESNGIRSRSVFPSGTVLADSVCVNKVLEYIL